ncbi:MAG: sodium-independent anion transporter, partial [Gemmatimonadales bacterium]
DRAPDARVMESILLLRVDAGLSFFNAEYFKRFVLERSRSGDREIRAVILDGMSINDLDTTAVEALTEVVEELEKRGIQLHLTGLVGPVRDTIRYSGLYRRMGRKRFHASPHQAVLHLLRDWDRKDPEGERIEGYRESVEEDVKLSPGRSDTD